MRQRDIAAWHESGHACAMLEVGALTGGVSIGDHGSGLTRTRNGGLWGLFGGSVRTREDFLLVGIAGPLVESWVSSYSVENVLDQQSNGSYLDGDRVAYYLNGDSLSYWVRKTERLLGGTYRGIESLAEALIDSDGYIDGNDAKFILRGRW